MTTSPSEHPVQNGPVQSEHIESTSDRAHQDAADYHLGTEGTDPASTRTDHPTGEAQAAENAETESPS